MASFAGGFNVRDTSLKLTKALPTNVTALLSSSLDMEASSRSDFVARSEMLLSAPALNATQLPNTTTLTYDIVHSATNSNLAGASTLIAGAIVQTGNTGAAAATYRFKLPTNVSRYVGFKMTGANVGNANFGDSSAVNATLEALF